VSNQRAFPQTSSKSPLHPKKRSDDERRFCLCLFSSLKKREQQQQELRDALEAKGLDSSGLKAVLLARLEESLESEGGGEEAAPEDEQQEVEEEEKEVPEKEATPEPESAPAPAAAPARAAPAQTTKQHDAATEEGELTKAQKDELKKKKREEWKAKQKAEYEAREAKRQAKKAEENKQFIETLEERKQRAAKFDGPFILSDAEKQRVRECGAAAQFGVSENAEAKPSAEPAKKEVSAEEKKRLEAEREAKKRARMERFGADALKPLHPPPANKKAKVGGPGGQDRNLTKYTI